MKKPGIKLKASLKAKVQRRLTYKIQKNKLFKNHWAIGSPKFVVKSLGFGTLDSKKIEMSRVFLRRAITEGDNREASKTKVFINTQMNRVFTKKSSNQRMGKGKGQVKGRFSTVFPGKVLFQLRIGKIERVLPAFKAMRDRLPFKVGLFCGESSFF